MNKRQFKKYCKVLTYVNSWHSAEGSDWSEDVKDEVCSYAEKQIEKLGLNPLDAIHCGTPYKIAELVADQSENKSK